MVRARMKSPSQLTLDNIDRDAAREGDVRSRRRPTVDTEPVVPAVRCGHSRAGPGRLKIRVAEPLKRRELLSP